MTLACAGCTSTHPAFLLPPPPPPPVPRVLPRHVAVSAPRISIPFNLPWLYPTNINPNLYFWTLQSSTDLVTWVDLPGNITGTPYNTGIIVVTNRYPLEFFRLKALVQ